MASIYVCLDGLLFFRHINTLTVIALFRNASPIHYTLHSVVRCHTVSMPLAYRASYIFIFFLPLKTKRTLKYSRFLNYMIVHDSCWNCKS